MGRRKKKKSVSLKQVGFYIEEDIWNEFKSLVAKKGRTIREVLEEEIEKWLEEHGDKKVDQNIFEVI
ncbi:MAG: plasmid partition protein ParG [Candidatus Baldrarchaeia archaeon]